MSGEWRTAPAALPRLAFPFAPLALGLDHLLKPMGEANVVLACHLVRPFLEARSDFRAYGGGAHFRFGLFLHAHFHKGKLENNQCESI